MGIRSVVVGVLAILVTVLNGGCGKSKPSEEKPNPPPSAEVLRRTGQPPSEVVARAHWIGMEQLKTETNATSFLKVWNLSETATLEAQTLDKLARWMAGEGPEVQSPKSKVQSPEPKVSSPAGAGRTNTVPLSGNAALLRPLLEDLVQEESFLEVRQATNQPGTLGLAIRLDAPRAELWQRNLAAVLESRTGARPTLTTNGWQVQVRGPLSRVSNQSSVVRGRSLSDSNQWSVGLSRSGDWTIFALAGASTSNQLSTLRSSATEDGSAPNPQPPSSLVLNPVTRQLQSALATPSAGFWLEANINPKRVAGALALGHHLPDDLPALFLEVTGNGKDMLTRCRLNFPKPLSLELQPWNIPTNLIHDPLVSFTAMRGIQPWLSSLKAWNDLRVGASPNQIFFWAQGGTMLFMSYCAAPLSDASNRVGSVTERLLRDGNLWITNNTFGRLEQTSNYTGVAWVGVPFMSPFLRSVAANGSNFAFGGLYAHPFTNQPPPGLLFHQITTRTNMVYYDWELTPLRVDQWLHIGQLLRLLFGRPELPPESAGMAWLNAAKTNMGNCVTGVGQIGPSQLTFTRASAAGLTALEMHLLADWCESSEFPHGLNTFVGPARMPAGPKATLPASKSPPRPNPPPPTTK